MRFIISIVLFTTLYCGVFTHRPGSSDGDCHTCGIDECGLFPPGVTPYSCPNGFVKDSCGCVTSCFCAGCPRFNALQCEFGYEQDADRCPRSQCRQIDRTATCPPCSVGECGRFAPGQTFYSCPHGFVKDSCGCQDTGCQCAGCPRFDNTLYCPNGYRTSRGCPRSVCNPRPITFRRCPYDGEPMGPVGPPCARTNQCPPHQLCCGSLGESKSCLNAIIVSTSPTTAATTTTTCPPCSVSECGLLGPGQTPYTCPNGIVKDSCGCEDSGCQCAGCPVLDTFLCCPNGYRTSRGCPVSVCNPGPSTNTCRCPLDAEPLGPVGPPCARKSDCPINQLCCRSIGQSKSCLNGKLMSPPPITTVRPPPSTTRPPGSACPGISDPAPTPGPPCGPNRRCPAGLVCCTAIPGSGGPPTTCKRGVPRQGPGK